MKMYELASMHHHHHHRQHQKGCSVDSTQPRRRTGKPISTSTSMNGARFPNLQSIPEDCLQEIGLGQNHHDERPSGPLPSSRPPLSPRSLSKVLLPTRLPLPSTSCSEMEDDDEMTPFEMNNIERRKHGLLPFRLSRTLNRLATHHANKMAKRKSVYHSVSTIDALKKLLQGNDVAENIQRGDTIVRMHIDTLRESHCINRSNVLSIYFAEFGYGVATGRDGKVYCCQLFRN